jgi:hypothetical protein
VEGAAREIKDIQKAEEENEDMREKDQKKLIKIIDKAILLPLCSWSLQRILARITCNKVLMELALFFVKLRPARPTVITSCGVWLFTI